MGSKGMDLWVKYLPHKNEDPRSDIQNICKRLGKVVSVVLAPREGREMGVSGTGWLVRPAESMNPRSSERLCVMCEAQEVLQWSKCLIHKCED